MARCLGMEKPRVGGVFRLVAGFRFKMRRGSEA